jgi:hypothetical protein
LRRDRNMWSTRLSIYLSWLVQQRNYSADNEKENRRKQEDFRRRDRNTMWFALIREAKRRREDVWRKRCDVHGCCKVERPETENKPSDYHQRLHRAVKRDFQKSRFVQGDWLEVHSHLILSQF